MPILPNFIIEPGQDILGVIFMVGKPMVYSKTSPKSLIIKIMVRPATQCKTGDLKYIDQNQDGVINEADKTMIEILIPTLYLVFLRDSLSKF